MTIEIFLPSEIARLVLGYLAELGCQKAHDTFLAECNDLREYASLLAGGLKFPTKVGGKTLLDILAEYCTLNRIHNNPQHGQQQMQRNSEGGGTPSAENSDPGAG